MTPSLSINAYILDTVQWPSGTATLTYSFVELFIPEDGDRDDAFGATLGDSFKDLVRDAMDAWEAVCGVEFVEMDDSADADIRIGGGTTQDSDGVAGTIAEAWLWSSGGIILRTAITFDPAETWIEELIYDAALHELGHVMGIDHSDAYNAVMSGLPATPYADQVGLDQLTPDDIAAAQAIYGGATKGDDLLEGTAGDDYINARAGNDTVVGNLGNDTLIGGAGNDYIEGDEADLEATQGGHDTINGGRGDDTLAGGPGNDLVNGQAGDDALFGDAGNDRLWGGGGDDDMLGGAGHDLLGGHIGDDFITGGAGNDTLAGQAGDDLMGGGLGNDRLWGGGGNDSLVGDEGNDLLVAHHGYDQLLGGAGNDTLAGQDGNDQLYGGEGADRLFGGAGRDDLLGGDGADALYGGEGGDYLIGGAGNDALWGGRSQDIFNFGAGHGHDTIHDFTEGEDLFDLRELHPQAIVTDYSVQPDGVLLDLSSLGGGTVLLKGVDSLDLGSEDFLIDFDDDLF